MHPDGSDFEHIRGCRRPKRIPAFFEISDYGHIQERMEGMYEQRVASRLMDVSRTTAIRFYGEDLRLRK